MRKSPRLRGGSSQALTARRKSEKSPMLRLSPIILAIACAACALPAAAGSARITVHGGEEPDRIPEPPSYSWPGNDPSDRGILWDQYWTPSRLGGPFDAAQAAIDADAIAHPRPSYRQQPWNADLAATLVRTGNSFSAHWLKCQRAYASYSLVTDTYDGPNGLPRPCRL